MPTLRKDPVSNTWVIIAEERGLRPNDFGTPPPQAADGGVCPFCEGNEHLTPPEIRALRPEGSEPNGPGWRARVVPNRYAALQVEGELRRRPVGIYDEMNGIGAHEVVIETPDHGSRMHEYSEKQMSYLLSVCHERVCDLSRDQRFRYVQIFRNHGHRAGASLEHPHTQVMALPIVPRWVKEELACAKVHWERTERSVFADIVEQERTDGHRLIFENEDFVVFEPFASLFPFETWVVPRRHEADIRQVGGEELRQLARALLEALRALAVALNDPPYNLVLHSAPFSAHDSELIANSAKEYRWHIEIIPRLTVTGGFEWGTGFHINPISPERAGDYLRQALARV
jgi:UDPglucose--hexose-1-phosphate uridylyltransferase